MSPALWSAIKSVGIVLWGAFLAALTGPLTQPIVEQVLAAITAALHDRKIDFGPWQVYAVAFWIGFAGQINNWLLRPRTPSGAAD